MVGIWRWGRHGPGCSRVRTTVLLMCAWLCLRISANILCWTTSLSVRSLQTPTAIRSYLFHWFDKDFSVSYCWLWGLSTCWVRWCFFPGILCYCWSLTKLCWWKSQSIWKIISLHNANCVHMWEHLCYILNFSLGF